MDDRKLTDADVRAIVDSLKSEIVNEFYADLGKGVWTNIKRGVFAFLIGIAAYGAWHGGQR